MGPRVTNPRPQKLRRTPVPGLGARQTGRNLHPASGDHKRKVTPRNPLSPQQHWSQPRSFHHQSVHQSISSLRNRLSWGLVVQSQTFTVHTCLPQTVCKVPVYLLSGRCPQNIMHHTYRSFTLSFFFVFFFVCVLLKSKKISPSSSPSLILSSCCNRQPSERLSPKRGPGGTGFQYGAKQHALAGTHSRHSALGQFNQETGREPALSFSCSF